MKILFLSEFFPKELNGEISGGAESRTFYLSRALSTGHSVTVLTSLTSDVPSQQTWGRLKVFRFGPKRGYLQAGGFLGRFLFFLNLTVHAATFDFDVVDANSVPTYLAAWLAAKIRGCHSVFWVPDLVGFKAAISHFGFIIGFLEALFEYFSIKILIPDAVIALSSTTATKIGRGTVVYPGVPVAPITKKNLTVISVNRLFQYKRTDLVVQAAKLLPKFQFAVIGDGEEKKHLLKIAPPNVTFLGNLPHQKILQKMAAAKIFVLASAVEGFGIVTLEAMAAGTPFVNSDIPVHREIATASGGGLLFRSGSAKDLAKQLEKLLTDQNLYEQLVSSGRKFAKKYSLGHQAKETVKVYESLLSHRRS